MVSKNIGVFKILKSIHCYGNWLRTLSIGEIKQFFFNVGFQAANPGAEIEDFVRWHSPRDWIEEEVVTSDGCKIEGELMRMGCVMYRQIEGCYQQ